MISKNKSIPLVLIAIISVSLPLVYAAPAGYSFEEFCEFVENKPKVTGGDFICELNIVDSYGDLIDLDRELRNLRQGVQNAYTLSNYLHVQTEGIQANVTAMQNTIDTQQTQIIDMNNKIISLESKASQVSFYDEPFLKFMIQEEDDKTFFNHQLVPAKGYTSVVSMTINPDMLYIFTDSGTERIPLEKDWQIPEDVIIDMQWTVDEISGKSTIVGSCILEAGDTFEECSLTNVVIPPKSRLFFDSVTTTIVDHDETMQVVVIADYSGHINRD